MPSRRRHRYPAPLRRGWEAQQAGDFARAEALFREVLAVRPRTFEALHLLGTLLARSGRALDGVDLIKKSLDIQPYNVAALEDLGAALLDLHFVAEAEDVYRRALALRPTAIAHFNLATTLQRRGFTGEAIPLLRKALALDPTLLQAAFSLAVGLSETGQEEEALPLFRNAVAARPQDPFIHSNLLFALLYSARSTEPEIFQEHLRWADRHAQPLARLMRPHANDRTPDRPLRVGYVSADFWEHAVSFFFEGLLRSHDPAQVEVFCYADVVLPDATTQRLRSQAKNWRNISQLSDDQAATAIREDRIDILVDLAGHSTGNRLQLFARRPAPVQVTYIGYPATTGMLAFDARLTDALADPPGQDDEFYTERLIRLPRTFLCYTPPAAAPDVNLLPAAAADAPITFCSFNNLAKIRRPCIELWAGVLAAVPGSRMLIKGSRLKDEAPRRPLLAWFADAGIPAERIEFVEGTASFVEHLAVYHRADIALDTFPYHGTTTTCEALWMGLPVVTLAGHAHRSRVGVSLLSSVGLPDLVARSPDDFVRIAAALANDRPRLASLRAGFRDRLRASPLLDCPALARAVEGAYRSLWRAWCPSTPH